MKGKLIFLIVLLLLAGAGIAGVNFISKRTPKAGVLKTESNQPATIFLDNRHLGRTPYEDKVMEGEYTLKLTPESVVGSTASWQGKIKILPNRLTYVKADLGDSEFNTAVDVLWLEPITSSASELSIVTNPDGATVSVDGVSKGVSPITVAGVSVGDHTIGLLSPGFAARTLNIKTTAGYKLINFTKLALSGIDLTMDTPQASPTAVATASATGKVVPSGKPTPSKTVIPSVTSKITIAPNPSVTIPDKPYVKIKDTPTGYLNVRSETVTNTDNIVGKVKPGELYTIIDTSADSQNRTWYKISYNGTDNGWVISTYVEKVE